MKTRRSDSHPIYGPDFAPVYDRHWSEFSLQLWPFLRRTVRSRNPGASSWLDVCCGTGALLEQITRAGFEGAGLDASPHQLAVARRRVAEARLVPGDVRSFNLGAEFDVITCIFDSLNYLTVKRDLERALRRVRRHLAPGGVFVFDVNTWEGLAKRWSGAMTVEDDDMTLVADLSFQPGRNRGVIEMRGFVREGRLYRKFEERHVQRGYRPAEIEASLEATGWIWQALDGETLTAGRPDSSRLVFVCGAR